MKKTTVFIMLSFILVSCGETNKKEQSLESATEIKTIETAVINKTTNTSNKNTLCKINGKNWQYTSADGLVTRNSQTKVRTAIMGFKRKLDKGSESIQLAYDVDKNVLNNVWVQLKLPNKEGKIITAFFTQYGDKIDLNPGASLTGTVALSEDSREASGEATITVLNDDKKNREFEAEYSKITISDLNFSGVPYSDTDDLKKLMNK